MTNSPKRGSQEFADIVPGRTTEVFFDLTERQSAELRQPALVMLQGDLPGQVFRLATGRNVIGRGADCHIHLREKAVSAHHAEVVASPAGVSVSDLSSTNGTVVNGRRIRGAVFLTQGNLLKLGNSVFRYLDSLVEVEMTETMHFQSTIDPVTNLWNRQHFLTRAAFLLDQSSASQPVTIIVVDVDLRGRSEVDETLQAVARALRQAADDLGRYFARIGDSSFAIVGASLTSAGAAPVSAKLRAALEAMSLTASIKLATSDRPGEPAEALLARAR